jgi:hypothetical protein
MIAVVAFYVGLIASIIGLAAAIRGSKRKGGRMRGALLLLFGLVIAAVALTYPPTESYVASPQTRIDEFMPVFQFDEVHSIRVAATPGRVYQAMKAVTPDEIPLLGVLTWLRRAGQPSPEGVPDAPGSESLLGSALKSSFVLLADQPNREVVLGTAVIVPPGFETDPETFRTGFKQFRAPGFAMAAMNFFIEPSGTNDSIISTETRVYATDLPTQKRFGAYWRVIYPGSSLIRRMWLRAIQHRAELPER